MKLNIQLFGGGGGGSWGGRGFRDVTHPGQRLAGHKEYVNPKTGRRGRYDPPKNGDPQHWHVHNPASKSNKDYYLDKDGKPVPRHSEEAALTKTQFDDLMRGKK